MISKGPNLDLYTKLIIKYEGATATDSETDINAKAKSVFAGIGCNLNDLSRYYTEVGRPLFKWSTDFSIMGSGAIPIDRLHEVKSFQVTSGNAFKCIFTDELLRDNHLCTHCLLKPDRCIHQSAEKETKKRGFGGGSRAENKRLAIAKYAGSSSTS